MNDPQAVRDPRPDSPSYLQSGQTGLQTNIYDPNVDNVDDFGYPAGGSRVIQWGWDPVGFSNPLQLPIPDNLEATGDVGSVTVVIS